MARKQPGSSNYNKARLAMLRQLARVRNLRRDALHKVANEVTLKHGTVVLEKLDIVALERGKHREALATHGLRRFGAYLHQKVCRRGGRLLRVPAQFTSQTCPRCGLVDGNNRLSQTKFRCVRCKHTDDADLVAAKNILRLGLSPTPASISMQSS
jgi:putative transposase